MDDEAGRARKATALQAAKAVFWAFFGVRKGKDHDADAVSITPVQAIVAGLIGAALFVLSLVLLVHFVTS
ncbi:MAG TPA: DUF2970 domain-containing protein [Burkholderiales bacterium]|nr:DUF2970 domain-containing protein [Burkholderiales bacterium]